MATIRWHHGTRAGAVSLVCLAWVLWCGGAPAYGQARAVGAAPTTSAPDRPTLQFDPAAGNGPEPAPLGFLPDDYEPPPAGESLPGAAVPDPITSAEHLRRSVEAFQAKDFMRAADELKAAYRQDPKPLLLFNVGQAYRRAGKAQEALDAYESFLRADPKNPLRPETEGYCNDMRALLVEQQRKAQVESALVDQQQRTKEKEQALRAEQERAQQAQRNLLAEQQRAEQERTRQQARRRLIIGLSVAGITLAVLGGAAVAVGVALRPQDPTTDGGFVNVGFALSR